MRGQRTGSAWMDDIRLYEIQPLQLTPSLTPLFGTQWAAFGSGYTLDSCTVPVFSA
jgi:hypothetical protein